MAQEVVQGEVIQQKVYPVQPGGQFAVPVPQPVGVRGNAAARRQYMANRRGGDGSGRLRKGHQLIIFGIAVIIILLIVLIVLLAVLLPRESGGGKSDDDDGQSSHNAPGYCTASATQCLPLWTDNTINGCSSHQEYCTNCDDSFHWCCTTNNCEGENDGWCRCNAGAPTKQPASGECLSVDRTCMASWTDATFPGCAATQNACSTDAFGNACDHTSSSPSTTPWCCLDAECEGEGSGWCYCKP